MGSITYAIGGGYLVHLLPTTPHWSLLVVFWALVLLVPENTCCLPMQTGDTVLEQYQIRLVTI
jgi:hypothetical protein